MDDLQAARERWQHDEPRYQEFLDAVEAHLKELLREHGVYAELHKRTKSLDSLLKKLLRKPRHTYDSLSDKAGMRVTVRYTNDITRVRSIIEGYFIIIKIDDKTASLAPDQFKYQGVHYDAKLPNDQALADLQVEIQLCTRAQQLWSDLSHDLAYKTVIDLPPAIHRQVHSLAALLEIVDREFQDVTAAIHALPNADAFHILAALEPPFYRINPTQYAKDLSIEVINTLVPLYPAETNIAGEHYSAFAKQHAPKLEHVLLQNRGRSPFLSQPEVIMIFDLLERDEFRLQERWNQCFPSNELEQLAVLWGTPLS